MIIDLILDRRDGFEYNAREFAVEVLEYCESFDAWPFLRRALLQNSETGVKSALCRYIREEGYNLKICDYVNSVNWL